MAINDAVGIKKKNIEVQKFFRRYFKLRFIIIIVIFILLFLLYKGFFKAAILMLIFTPTVVYSMRISKFIPNLNIEVLSASSLLIGYLYGPIPAAFFAIVVGFFGIFKSNYVTYLFIVRIICTALVAAIMSFYTSINFNLNFILGILLMNVILWFVYLVIDPDPLQNVTHRISHLFWNLLVVRFIYVALYELVKRI
jgi:hypothetical protein